MDLKFPKPPWLLAGFALLLGLISLSACAGIPLREPGGRSLTADEISQMRTDLESRVARLSTSEFLARAYQDRRSPATRQNIEAFQRAWAKVNPTIAPFLGERRLFNWVSIYPSPNPEQVCVNYSWGNTTEGEGRYGEIFSVGFVANGEIRTQNNEILLLRGPYLALFAIGDHNKPFLSLSPHPEPLPELGSTGISANFKQKLERAGCTTKLPGT